MGSPSFRLPKYGLSYSSDVISRSSDLIGRGIWSGIKPVRLRRWLKNFETDEDRYFAACVLDSMIYRSDEQTTSLAVHLFQRSLVDLARLDPPTTGPAEGWLDCLRGQSSPIRLVCAVKRSDFTHKSGHLVSRLMKRQLQIRQQWISKAWELDQHVKAGGRIFVFIDDFLGTGQQFEELIQQENLDWIFERAYVAYAPFVAHKEGIRYLTARYPNLRITAAETLDERHGLFNQKAKCFDDGVNTPDGAKEFYFDLVQRKRLAVRQTELLGFGGLALAYVFEHAVPDNNLPILWSPGSANWMPLFDR